VQKDIKMKPMLLYFFLVAALSFLGCAPVNFTELPTITQTQPVSPVIVSITPAPSHVPTISATMTALVLLEPEKAQETIRTLLQEPMDCFAPCFLGIVPEKTTQIEAENIFTRFRLPVKCTIYENNGFCGITYRFGSGLDMDITITIRNNIVENLRVDLLPEKQQETSRKWRVFSPETLVKRYGSPSRVDLFLGRAAPTPDHSMVLYFASEDLIVEYFGYDYRFDGTFVKTCPLINQWFSVRVWMGKNPQFPPSSGVSLEKATSLTLEEFSALMTGDPQQACLNLKESAFP